MDFELTRRILAIHGLARATEALRSQWEAANIAARRGADGSPR